MFSICIPTYNYDIRPLVESLYWQSREIGIPYEILVADDASTNLICKENNRQVKHLGHVSLFELEENIGRSKIRNFLAEKARYDWLLFLDCDVMPCSNQFVQNYLNASANTGVIVGGIRYRDEFPGCEFRLRWEYGRRKESVPAEKRQVNPYKSFMTGNFFIQRAIFSSLKFDESISQYGHEDTLFGIQLNSMDVVVSHIDNPVFHDGLEPDEQFLKKIKQSVDTLSMLMANHPLRDEFPRYIRLSSFYLLVRDFGFMHLLSRWFEKHEQNLRKQLFSDHPNMRLLDLYKLGYMCNINSQSRKRPS